MWMFVAIGVVLVLAIGGGIWVAASGSDKASAPVTTDAAGNTIPDSQPVTVTGTALPAFDTAATLDPAVGLVAPVLVGKNFAGQPVTISPAKGAYMVVFLAHWCPHCNREVPVLNAWKHSGTVPAALNVVGVTTAVDSSRDFYPPSTWISNKGWEWPVLADQSQGASNAGKAAAAFGATGWPYMVIVGADGKVKARLSGEIAITDLKTIVAKALAA
jgi:cytochrome c biogenesis protein CcmG/thiol:disulfide interchange protein DsbE